MRNNTLIITLKTMLTTVAVALSLTAIAKEKYQLANSDIMQDEQNLLDMQDTIRVLQYSIFNIPQPKTEVRAVWLTTIGGLDWPRTKAGGGESAERQRKELTRILDQLQQANINTVLLQTRVRGTVIYPSDIEPWDDCLTGHNGKNPGYDPLKFAIEECHKRGMEIHAWMVCVPLGKLQKQRSLGSQSIMKRHPKLCKTVNGEVFMIPGNPETADYIAKLCEEVVSRYDIDGIHLDYIRYPEKTYRFSDDNLYSTNRAGFSNIREWRRGNITRIVEKIHDRVKSAKPWVKLSCSPIGKYKDLARYSSMNWNCYDAVSQDPQAWLRTNKMDMLFPMMYFQGNHFYPFLFNWKENCYGHPVVPGLGIYFLDPREGHWQLNDVRAEIHTARRANIGGVAFYRSDFLTRDCKGIYCAVKNEFFPYPALTPRMTWSNDTLPPSAPESLVNISGTLHWEEAHDNSGTNLLYNVYGSNIYPVDVSCAENLIAARLTSTSYSPTGEGATRRYFAVTASDRYGNESLAAQEVPDTLSPQKREDGAWLNVTKDKKIELRKQAETAADKKDRYIIYDISGRPVCNDILPAPLIDASQLPPGIYKLMRRINKKHNLLIGYFRI